MPTLDWLDREHAFRIAARVSTRVLRPHERAPSTAGDAAVGNLLVQGDKLEALAALLPFYPRPREVHLRPSATRRGDALSR